MSSFATTLASQTQNGAFTQNSANSAEETEQSASDGDTKSNMTHETGSSTNTETSDNTLDNADDGVAQDLFELLENQRPDHLHDPDGDGWAALIATLSRECDDYVTEGRMECVCAVPKYLSIGLPVTFGRVGVERRLVTCMMTIGTDGVRLIPHDIGDEEKQRERCLNDHSEVNAMFETAFTDLSGPGNFTLKQLLQEVKLNETKAKTILGNENDSAGWRVLTNTGFSLFIGVMDPGIKVDPGKEVWYDALEEQSPRT